VFLRTRPEKLIAAREKFSVRRQNGTFDQPKAHGKKRGKTDRAFPQK